MCRENYQHATHCFRERFITVHIYSRRLGGFLQSEQWIELRRRHGWKAITTAHGFCLVRPIAKFFPFAYAPFFGVHQLHENPSSQSNADRSSTSLTSPVDITAFHQACNAALRALPLRAPFIRWDLPYYLCDDPLTLSTSQETKNSDASDISLHDMLYRQGLRKAFHDVQMRSTRIIALDQSEDALLAQMKSKGRYNIRLAHKKGVRVGLCGVDDFYTLHKKTCDEKHIAARPLSYMHDVSSIFGDACRCYGAYLNNRMIASIMVLHFDGCASYLFGGTDREGMQTMASYAIQWHAITQAKKLNMDVYDFMGIHEGDKRYAGITQFKEKFGGMVVHRMGAWDIPKNRLLRALVNTGERLRGR